MRVFCFVLANDVYENTSAINDGNGEKELLDLIFDDIKMNVFRFNKCTFVKYTRTK